jgi:hypothetical protein
MNGIVDCVEIKVVWIYLRIGQKPIDCGKIAVCRSTIEDLVLTEIGHLEG